MKESVAAIHFGFIKRRATCPELTCVCCASAVRKSVGNAFDGDASQVDT